MTSSELSRKLRSTWRKYHSAKKSGKKLMMIEYAKQIRAIQAELKITPSPFPDISAEDLK